MTISPSGNINNNSPQVNSSLIVYAQQNKDFKFNLAAFDEDGDFLTYKLVETKGTSGNIVPNYSFPLKSSIDLINGSLLWEKPQTIGYHQFTIERTECRNDEFIAATLVDLAIFNGTSNHSSQFYNAIYLDTNQSGSINYRILPGDSISFNLDYQSNDTFNLRLIDGTNRALYDDEGNFKFVSKTSDLRCAPYVFILESDTRCVLDHETIMIQVIDTNIINCDTLCGFRVLSLEKSKAVESSKVIVYPNPFSQKTTFTLPIEGNENYSFELFNNLGQLQETRLNMVDDKLVLTRQGLQGGVYFFVFKSGSKKYFSGKVVID